VSTSAVDKWLIYVVDGKSNSGTKCVFTLNSGTTYDTKQN
jgi:hypothetical protein